VFFIKSYLENSGDIDLNEIEAGLYGFMADWITWLEFNLSRIVSHQQNKSEYNLGTSEALKTLKALPIIINQFTNIIETFYEKK